MKQLIKTTFGVVAAIAMAGLSVAPAAMAWGDNMGGRPSYTVDQINQGALGNKIVFNSISNGVIGSEKNFVGARLDTGINAGPANVWNSESINVEEGKTYLVRLYVHNNNPNGRNAVAQDVTTNFGIPTTVGTEQKITGYINSSNATPTSYWDSVVFKSNRNFALGYVAGSARLENNGIGAISGGLPLGDNIVRTGGVKIGYDALDGKIPGCFQYASYITIKVKPIFQDTGTSFFLNKQVRIAGTSEWKESITAKVGDKIEYMIVYRNTSMEQQNNVLVKDQLPANIKYVPGTAKFRAKVNGADVTSPVSDNLFGATGANIGHYAPNSVAYVWFTAEIVDKNLACGNNTIVNYGDVRVGATNGSDPANIVVNKTCKPTDKPKEEPKKPTETTPVTPSNPVSQMPTTGPASVVASVVGAASLTISLGYYLASRKKLL